MTRVLPCAEYLNMEEVDYELSIRNQPEDVYALDLASKQRLLRMLFKDDLKENRSYQSPYSIMAEFDHIVGRIDTLEKALERKVEAKYESRVLHYYYRVKWSQAKGEDEKKLRRELCRRIEEVMDYYQFGPPRSPVISQINGIITNNGQGGAVGGQVMDPAGKGVPPIGNEQNAGLTPGGQGMGAIPKLPKESGKNQAKIEVSQDEWNDMRKMLAELTDQVSRVKALNSLLASEEKRSAEIANPFTFPSTSISRQRQKPSEEVVERGEERPPTRPKSLGHSKLQVNIYQKRQDVRSSDEESVREVPRVPRRDRRRRDDLDSYEESLSGYDTPNYGFNRQRNGHRNRRCGVYSRVEKWKLRFSGDPRGVSVENFLYKAVKLAEREGTTKQELLRDIHMLLEGAASDWFFTYVDELLTWQDFYNGITYRFGNPNKDQGIRSKIQERKQQRGESFIAFVSEIEKLNRMLSQPLSNRRKFEVIWDNMRQHYRSKIAIVRVRDLNHLIDLNYRIDAADHQLQPTSDTFVRRPVNQIEAEDETSDEETEQSTAVNMIKRDQARNRPPINRSNAGATEQYPSSRQREDPEQGGRLGCWNCQEVGHGWRQCTKPRNIFCYGCGNLGRTIRSCEKCTRRADSQGNTPQGN